LAQSALRMADATHYVVPGNISGSAKRNSREGEYNVQVTNIGIYQTPIGKWTDPKKKKIPCPVNKEFASALSSHLLERGWTDDIDVNGATGVSSNTGMQRRWCFARGPGK